MLHLAQGFSCRRYQRRELVQCKRYDAVQSGRSRSHLPLRQSRPRTRPPPLWSGRRCARCHYGAALGSVTTGRPARSRIRSRKCSAPVLARICRICVSSSWHAHPALPRRPLQHYDPPPALAPARLARGQAKELRSACAASMGLSAGSVMRTNAGAGARAVAGWRRVGSSATSTARGGWVRRVTRSMPPAPPWVTA